MWFWQRTETDQRVRDEDKEELNALGEQFGLTFSSLDGPKTQELLRLIKSSQSLDLPTEQRTKISTAARFNCSDIELEYFECKHNNKYFMNIHPKKCFDLQKQLDDCRALQSKVLQMIGYGKSTDDRALQELADDLALKGHVRSAGPK
ncbi:hypothetical protein CANCADRAFT_4279 [Tortispora caseinolytica NRRL Y-17796]|uniref:Uncharacterized protein n=1 Tax=Tortispora caseinolytica NRRL Y-17796 TaxID=767744 RepID=A0A1E4TD19_9ASCO|nr:hypothetical protein CANCADRAFT_4279 [Tortispora caseinolytica NRRL Y-17796]